jgi:hypothetical protein
MEEISKITGKRKEGNGKGKRTKEKGKGKRKNS